MVKSFDSIVDQNSRLGKWGPVILRLDGPLRGAQAEWSGPKPRGPSVGP